MKRLQMLVLMMCVFFGACGDCKKMNLTNSEKQWINHFRNGQASLYRSKEGHCDTLLTTEVRNFYTPCNKFELSEYQYEVLDASFAIRSESAYNNTNVLITYETSAYKPRVPSIFFGNIGPYKKESDNKMPIAIDTIVGDIELKSVCVYSTKINAEDYGERRYFRSFFWSKTRGLMAYTTFEGEFFFRVDK